MAVIKSGNSTDQLTVDPNSKAAHVTLYDTTGAVQGTIANPVNVALGTSGAIIGQVEITDGTNVLGTVAHPVVTSSAPDTDRTVTGNFTNSPANFAISTQGGGTVLFNILGTWSGTIFFEASVDGTNWVPALALPKFPSGAAAISSTTANGQWAVNTGGLNMFRLRSAAWVSGTATIWMEVGQATNVQEVFQFFPANLATNIYASGTAVTATGSSLNVNLTGSSGSINITQTDATASGNITSNQTVVVSTQGKGAVSIGVTGAWTGTLVVEASVDGVNWNTAAVVPLFPGGPGVSSITANGQWTLPTGGVNSVRVRGNTVTSGSAAITLEAGAGQFGVAVFSFVPANLQAQVSGSLTNNNAAPAANNVGVLPAVANAASPTYTEGDQVLHSTDLSGYTRVTLASSGIPGSAAPSKAVQVAGTDGTNLRVLSTSATGVLNVSGGLPGQVQTFTLTTATPGAGNTQNINMLQYVNMGLVITAINGGTIAVEVSVDNGVTWSSADVWQESTESYINSGSITAAGTYWLEPLGAIWFARVRCLTFGSGNITGTMIGTIAPNMNLEYTGQAGTLLPNNLVAIGGNVTTAAPIYSNNTINAISLDTLGNTRVLPSGVFSSTPPNLTNGQQAALQLSSSGDLAISLNDVGTQPGILQKVNAVSTGSVASLQSPAFVASNTIGNTIVVLVGYGSNGTITVTDLAGNSYKVAYIQNNGTAFGTAIFYATNVVNFAANKITVSTTVSSSIALQAYEVAGTLISSSGIVGDRYAATGTNPLPQTGMVTPQGPYSIAFQAVAIGTSTETVVSAGQGWTLDNTLNPASATGLFTLIAESAIFGSMGASNNGYTDPTTAPFTLTAVAASTNGTATYTGTITGGAANAFAGFTFVITGFAAANNNGIFTCTASTATTLVLSNPASTAVTAAGTATATQGSTGNTILSGANAYAAVTVTFRNAPLAVQGVVSQVDGGRATYRYVKSAYSPVAGATLTIIGSPTKIIRVTKISASGTAGTAVFEDVSVQRSAVAAGTTGTLITAGQADSIDPPATATVETWATAPTLTTPTILAVEKLLLLATATLTTVPNRVEFFFGNMPGTKELVIRGTNDMISLVFSSAPATGNVDITIETTEE